MQNIIDKLCREKTLTIEKLRAYCMFHSNNKVLSSYFYDSENNTMKTKTSFCKGKGAGGDYADLTKAEKLAYNMTDNGNADLRPYERYFNPTEKAAWDQTIEKIIAWRNSPDRDTQPPPVTQADQDLYDMINAFKYISDGPRRDLAQVFQECKARTSSTDAVCTRTIEMYLNQWPYARENEAMNKAIADADRIWDRNVKYGIGAILTLIAVGFLYYGSKYFTNVDRKIKKLIQEEEKRFAKIAVSSLPPLPEFADLLGLSARVLFQLNGFLRDEMGVRKALFLYAPKKHSSRRVTARARGGGTQKSAKQSR